MGGGPSLSAANAPPPIADPLLRFLREALERPGLAYAEPPTLIPGGAVVHVHGFRLDDDEAADDAAGPLVARIWRAPGSGASAERESAVQNALAQLGYPAPRVLACCDDPRWLGAPFQVMERVPGEALLRVGNNEASGSFVGQVLPDMGRLFLRDWPGRLAGLHARLHRLDPKPVVAALDRIGVAPREIGVAARVERLARLVEAHDLAPLEASLAWLRANAPGDDAPRGICHGDLFANQIFVDRGRARVLDWSDVTLGPPEFDVGIVSCGVATAPVELPGPLQAVGEAAQRWLARRFLAAYRAHAPLDEARLRFAELFRAFSSLTHVLARRRERAADASLGPNPYDSDLGVARLGAVLAAAGLAEAQALRECAG
ncbi:MAG TPA: phosphotransferase [Myxococcota bacterium]|nr:phosphotransferase [Myxococcota bacterium]